MNRSTALLLVALLSLTACDVTVPAWMGGPQPPKKRAPGERLTVIVTQPKLAPEAEAEPYAIEIPDQVGNDTWLSRNQAMATSHIGLTGITQDQSATIGDGFDFTRNTAPSPVVADGRVYAMDAAGIISAHDERDISDVLWSNESGVVEDVEDVLGGGLVAHEGVLYATTGYGTLLAIDAKTGKTKWQSKVGAPVRGAPCYVDGLVVVLTADNQTLAFTAETGGARWEHRGIRESAGYFATTAPVASDGIVVSAYTSGEIFALRAETGSVLWSDSVSSQVKTRASAVFSGIDADPIVQDGVVIVISAGGVMQASALLNGRPLWQQKIAGHQTPWSAGNAIFLISDTHDVAALIKRNGAIRWATALAESDGIRDVTPPLYGPILAGNAVMVVDRNGSLRAFKPEDGKALGEYELADGIITPPVVAGGALYVVTQDATLRKYY
jgi:outer membrane protein assembly factor BamB